MADALLNMECSYYDSLKIHDRIVIFGEVETFYIADELLVDGKTKMDRVDTVGRLGGPYYTGVNQMELTRQF